MSDLQNVLENDPNAKQPPDAHTAYKWSWWSDFDNQVFDDSYIVQDILVPDQPCMITGFLKTLKTTLMLDLAISISTGRDFMNRFQVLRPQPVAVMSCESGPRVIQNTLRRIALSKGLTPQSVQQSLAYSGELPKIDDPKHHIEISRFLKDTGAKILMLDNLYLSMSGGDWSNSSDMGGRMKTTLDICREAGALFVYTHHTKKTVEQFRPMNLEDCTGAGFAEFAGQWLLLNRQEAYKDDGVHPLCLRPGSREDSGKQFSVRIEEGRKDDPGGRHYSIFWTTNEETVVHKKRQKAQEKFEKDVRDVIGALHDLPNMEGTKANIKQECGVQGLYLTKVLDYMLADKQLAVNKKVNPNNNQEYDYYQLLLKTP